MSSTEPSVPTESTNLRDYPWVVVRLRCHFCRRGGDYRLADIAAKHGPYITMGRIVFAFVGGCRWAPWNPERKPQKYGMKCGGFCPDLLRPEPPDLPPGASGSSAIQGGKPELQPVEFASLERRRNEGAADA
jgi:hypothetical protein